MTYNLEKSSSFFIYFYFVKDLEYRRIKQLILRAIEKKDELKECVLRKCWK